MPAPSAIPILTLAGLTKAVPGPRTLFEGLEFALRPGELVAIMGESGVGKSTLLNVVAGLDTADAGSVCIDGTMIDKLDEDARTRLRRARIGFVFQAFHVLPHLTLAQNVALPLVLLHETPRTARARAEAMLDAVGLPTRASDYPRQLSGGELQRVAIARALVHGPALILADEPTGNLDPETAGRILDLLAAQVRQAGAAAMIVTHSEVAAAVADRVLRLHRTGLIEAPRP